MIRIIIEWSLILPILKVVSGVLLIEDVDIVNQHYKLLLKCGVKCEPGVVSFFTEDNDDYFIDSKLIKKYDEHIKDLMRAYHGGVLLEDTICSWVDEDKDEDEDKAV